LAKSIEIFYQRQTDLFEDKGDLDTGSFGLRSGVKHLSLKTKWTEKSNLLERTTHFFGDKDLAMFVIGACGHDNMSNDLTIEGQRFDGPMNGNKFFYPVVWV
jgi:hypothetical protein